MSTRIQTDFCRNRFVGRVGIVFFQFFNRLDYHFLQGGKLPRALGRGVCGWLYGFKPTDPLRFNGWVGTVFGVIGRGIRYDERITIGSEDMDLSLQHLQEHRIIFIDERFHFESPNRLRALGGVSVNRSLEREMQDSELIQTKWGKFIEVYFKESGIRVKSVRVPRRQAKVK